MRRSISNGLSGWSAAQAGLLGTAPQCIPFEQRLLVFRALVAEDKERWQPKLFLEVKTQPVCIMFVLNWQKVFVCHPCLTVLKGTLVMNDRSGNNGPVTTHVDDDALTILPGSHVAAGLAQFFRHLQFVH